MLNLYIASNKYIAQAYGEGQYGRNAYSATSESSGASSGSASSGANNSGTLVNTGVGIVLVATLALTLIFCALVIRFIKRKPVNSETTSKK